MMVTPIVSNVVATQQVLTFVQFTEVGATTGIGGNVSVKLELRVVRGAAPTLHPYMVEIPVRGMQMK